MVRARDAFVLRSAWDAQRDRLCTLLLPGARADIARFAEVVRAVAAAHADLAPPHIPAVVAHDADGDKPFVAFDCAAVMDGQELQERLGAGPAIPYEGADAFIASLRAALERYHRGDDPARCLGRISLANVLFDADGGWHLVGFGRNFPVEDEFGRPDGAVTFFHAPEVGVDGPPSPVGDFIALRLMMRTLLGFVELPPGLRRVLRGEVEPDDLALVQALLWFEHEVMAQVPQRRPSLREIVAQSDRVRALLGVTPSPTRYAEHVAALLRARKEKSGATTLVVAVDGATVVLPDGERVRLSGASRRIMLALAAAHARGADAVLSMWELVEAGWPGERIRAESAANRAYVTVNRMRAAGLAGWIERVDAGYRLAPSLQVKVA
ncbi:MAG: hypothetical protein U0325_12500 [Polyangiales bacterium]